MTGAPVTINAPICNVACPECGLEMRSSDNTSRGPVECDDPGCRLYRTKYRRQTVVLTRYSEPEDPK